MELELESCACRYSPTGPVAKPAESSTDGSRRGASATATCFDGASGPISSHVPTSTASNSSSPATAAYSAMLGHIADIREVQK